MPKVFVYGTLKRGFGNNRLLAEAEFLGNAFLTTPFAFKDLGSFPGLVRTRTEGPGAPEGARGVLIEGDNSIAPPTRVVGGELWECNDIELARLDRLEGHPNFYERQDVAVHMPGTGEVLAETYTLPPEDTYLRLPEVPTYFWRQSEDEAVAAATFAMTRT